MTSEARHIQLTNVHAALTFFKKTFMKNIFTNVLNIYQFSENNW